MSVIHVDVLSSGGIDKAVRSLEDWYRHAFLKTVDDFTEAVAKDVIDDVWRSEHIVTWKLRNETKNGQLKKVRDGYYQKEIDPVDIEDGKQVHYAQREREKGGSHDFVELGLARSGERITARKGMFSDV